MSWGGLNLAGGVVITRRPSVLGEGELSEAIGIRYAKADPIQIHKDTGDELFSQYNSEFAYMDMHYVGLEGKNDKLLAVGATNSVVFAGEPALGLYTTNTGIVQGDPWVRRFVIEQLGSYEPKVTAAIHVGDEYVVGVGAGYNVTMRADGGAVRHGMRAFEDTPYVNRRPTFDQSPASIQDWSIYEAMWTRNPESGLNRFRYSVDTTRFFGSDETGVSLPDGNYVYWVTEYDEENDYESQPYYTWWVDYDAQTEHNYPSVSESVRNPVILFKEGRSSTGYHYGALRISWSDGDLRANENTTHFRFYRAAVGAEIHPSRIPEVLRLLLTNDNYWVGQFIGEAEYGKREFVDDVGLAEGVSPYPIIQLETGDIFDALKPPRPFNQGAFFNGSLVVNSPTESGNVIRYSVVDKLGSFPDPYFAFLATEGSDSITGFHNVGNSLLVTTLGAVQRINYLPYPDIVGRAGGDAIELVDNVGCQSYHGSTPVTLPQGQVLVWLGPEGLRLTTGQGSIDPCRDWSVAAAGLTPSDLENVLLWNDVPHERLRMKLPSGTEWHFYYGVSHVKETGFKVSGPHSYRPYKRVVLGPSRLLSWGLGDAWIYTLNRGHAAGDMVVQTGRLRGPHPRSRISLTGAMLQHTPMGNTEIRLGVFSKSFDSQGVSKAMSFLNADEEEFDHIQFGGISGNWYALSLSWAGGVGPMSMGPLLLKEQVSSDGVT